MLKNVKKLAISKQFLISLVFITLMFTAFGINVENSYAADLNVTDDDLGIELDVEDKLENSQNNEILSKSYSLNGGTYSDIQALVDKASAGDTIKLSGTFVAKSSDDIISVNKKLTITSDSSATLDGKKKSNAFQLKTNSAGTKVSNLIFQNGYSSNEGGAIRITGKNIVIDNCVFKNNNAKSSSGALHTSYTPKVAEGLTVKNCKFTGNTATYAAGALGVFGYNFKIDNCVFDSNSVKSSKNCYGGAIQVGLDTGLSKGVVSNCKFTNNNAVSTGGTSHGGAGCLRNGTTYKNCEFTGNSADHGGAITFHASGKLDNCIFKNNKANDYGGALSISLEQKTMDLTINKCNFEGNSAPLGGAAKLDGMNIKIQNSNFTSNTATKYGGAVNIDAKDVTILSSNFKKNTAKINGGAVFITGKNTVINKSSFVSNEAIPNVKNLNDGLGGAVYVNSTQASINSNTFKLNTARNGSAVYYDKSGNKLTLKNNVMTQNQAWVYLLPVYAHDIDYGEVEEIKSVIYGGNNIAKYNDLTVSNAIYNAAKVKNIQVDGQNPVLGATMSGDLYQDGREYNMKVLLTVNHEDGTVVYNKTLLSSYLGEVSDSLENLRPGKYYVTATHYEDTYYKGITNVTTFRVIPKVDNMLLKVAAPSDEFNYEDKVVWTLDITNNGPNNATNVVVKDVLPEGLIYYSDDSGGKYDPKTGTLTIGNLAVGEHVIVNIITIINKTGDITNDANVTANEYDINLTNNKDNATISVNPAIDLAVEKSVNNTKPNYGDIVDWKIVVSNNGPDIAHDVKVMDMLPKSLVYISSTGNYNRNGGFWNIGTMNVGEKVILHIISKVNSTGVIENYVSVSGSELDHDLSNNQDNESISVRPASDLAIDKSVNVSTANYDDLVKWTLMVTNKGPNDATGVYVIDTLPEGFVYVESHLERGTYSDGKITIGNLKVGETLKLEIICRVKNTGNFVNVATITGNEYDQNLTNNKDNESISVYPAADLQVIKEVNNTNPNYNDSIIWTITVKNNGPNDAHNVKVSDVLPNSVLWINDDSNGKYNHVTGLWTVGQLNNGKSVKLNILCKVNATGSATNKVNVTGSEYDYNKTNNFDNESINVKPASDLSVQKSVNDTKPNYNDLVKWTVTVSNNGPDRATGVYVDEILPNGLILINYTATKGFYDNGMWAMCCLNSSEVQTLELICKVNKTGKIINIVTVSGNEYDPNPENNEDNESIQVPPSVDLELIKEVNNTNPEFGDIVQWTVIVKNNGPDKATSVYVEEDMPDELIIVDWSASKGYYKEEWCIGDLDVGEIAYCNITTRVNGLGEISNYAEVFSKEYDWNESNNYDVASVDVSSVVDLSIMKTVNNTSPNYGDTVKWTLIVTNNGPNDASGVVVYDNLPDGLTFIEAVGGEYEDGIWNIGDLDAESSVVLEIVCKVSATGSFINNASVFGDEYDPDMSNNNDSESIEVPPASDISITKIASKYYYTVGDIVRYAIEVINNGPDKAENVKVSEVMDDSLKLKSFKASVGDFDKLTKTWDVGSLEVGESASLDLDAVATKKGVLNNTVKASSDNYDPDLSDNEDFASVDVSDKESPSPENPKTSKTPENHEKVVENRLPDEIAKKILEKNVSGNSLFILLFSLIFSMVILRGDISKRK